MELCSLQSENRGSVPIAFIPPVLWRILSGLLNVWGNEHQKWDPCSPQANGGIFPPSGAWGMPVKGPLLLRWPRVQIAPNLSPYLTWKRKAVLSCQYSVIDFAAKPESKTFSQWARQLTSYKLKRRRKKRSANSDPLYFFLAAAWEGMHCDFQMEHFFGWSSPLSACPVISQLQGPAGWELRVWRLWGNAGLGSNSGSATL